MSSALRSSSLSTMSRPSVGATVRTSSISCTAPRQLTLARIAKRRRPGTTSCKSCSRLLAVSGDWEDRPVTFPPGRASDATRPPPTRSASTAKTIGITDVTRFTAGTAFPRVAMTSTLSRTNSAGCRHSARGYSPPSDIQSRCCAPRSSRVHAAAAQKQRPNRLGPQACPRPGTR
jgi:hypothetical protein